MKLTWFGGTTLRIHIGGLILVADAGVAPAGIDAAELVSGADRVFGLAAAEDCLPQVDLALWKPRRIRPLDAGPVEATILRAGAGLVLVHVDGERPLLLVAGELLPFGRWLGDAVVVLFGSAGQLVANGRNLLERQPPRLLALAAADAELDQAIPALRAHLDDTALVALESRLGLEL
ncbi:hypothetical protein [Devosia sp. 1566]|uniref:hypothetical protein n=1 Tax=Devosia sp. 1566 TaxID=2499144 RepID=UPI000FD79D1A|nr:hypothetical protein [Devosia sp. 1566]